MRTVSENQIEKQEKLKFDEEADSFNGILCLFTRNKRERWLLLAFLTVLVIAIILGFSLAIVTNAYCHKDSDVCLSKGCVITAAAVLDRLDDSTDPCDDFFQFSCGSFIKKTIIPDEKSAVTMFSELEDSMDKKMRPIVEAEIRPEDSETTKMMKTLYRSCNDTDAIELMGVHPLDTILGEYGGWPVVEGDKWDESNFSWIETLYQNRRTGYSVTYLFSVYVSIDVKNSSWRLLWLDQPSLILSRDYLMKGLNDSDVQAYLNYSVNVAMLLGADPNLAEKEMEDVLKFEMEIANISLPREERRNITKLYNTMTIAELSSKVPQIPWIELFNEILTEPLKIDDKERIGVSDPNFFVNFIKLIERTPNRTIANYLMWRIVSTSVPYLSSEFRLLLQEFSRQLTGKTSGLERWKWCLGLVGELAYGMSNLYVKNFFNNDTSIQVEKLVTYIRKEFDRILHTVDWMDEETRKLALEKANTVKTFIGYPEELLMDEKLTEHYTGLVIDDKDVFLDNIKRYGIFSLDYSFGKLREMVDKLDWKNRGDVAVVNAYYNFVENAIKLPAGILQGVFFEPDRPSYMNFGSIGSIIGHEITHGFDDQGKQYDSEGNLSNWWEKHTENKFLEKAKCIIWQYGNYTATEVDKKINGINTQGENIADNGGIKEAYKAYQKWVQDNGAEKQLPGMTYSPNQLFWISAAQVWCSKVRPESLKLWITNDAHAPSNFRVIGSFSNSKEFAVDWNCPVGSKMNPKMKCQVW